MIALPSSFPERQPPPVLAARLHASRLAACAAQWLEQEEHHGKRSEAGGVVSGTAGPRRLTAGKLTGQKPALKMKEVRGGSGNLNRVVR